MSGLDSLFRDVRYASRSIPKNPGFATAAVLTLALGIGANIAIFSVLEGAVLQPLPYREPDRLVVVALYNRALQYATYLSYPDFLDWQRESRSFQQIAAFTSRGLDLTNPGAPERVDGMEISADFFRTLSVRMALGREILPEEDRSGSMPAVVISDRLWRGRFAGAAAVLGKSLALNGVDYTVGRSLVDVAACAQRTPTARASMHDVCETGSRGEYQGLMGH
jgi:putative ABC transport system permease protein